MRNLFFLILFLSHTGFAQESIVRLWQKGNLTSKVSDEKALIIFEKAFNEAVKQKSLLWQATICVDQSGSLYATGKYKDAVERCLLGLKILKENNIKNDSTQFKLYSALGACYDRIYNLKESLKNYYEANRIIHEHPDLEKQIPLYVTYHYSNQGKIWYNLADMERSAVYFEKGLSMAKNLPVKSDYAIILTNVSGIYMYKHEFKKSIELFKEAVSNYQIKGIPINDISLAHMYYNLAECYLEIGEFKLSNEFINKSKTTAVNNLPQKQAYELLPVIDLFIANSFLKQGNLSSSSKLFSQIIERDNPETHYKHLFYTALRGMAEIEVIKGNQNKALNFIQRALSKASGEELINGIKNPKLTPSMYTAIGIFSLLNRKVEILMQLYKESKNKKFLFASFETQQLSVNIAKKIRQSHETIESRVLFSNNFYSRYEKLTELAYNLYQVTNNSTYIKTCFNIIEESKSIILSDNLTIQNSYRNMGSDSLIVKLKANQAYLAYLKGSLEKQNESIKTYEFKVNEILEKLSIINKVYIESYKSESKVNLKSFQQKLDSKSLYLNYIVIENQLYTTLTKKNKITLKKTPINPEEFISNKNLLKTALTTNPGPYSGFKARKSAAYFYNILIRPFEADLKGIDNLIINPDNEMIELSFDILVPHEKSNDYLIKKYNISYLNSALNYNDKIKNKFSRADQNWLSFAPFGSKTKNSNGINIQNLTILPSTIKEINGIKGQSIINEKSTKQTFVKTISELKDRVILIATHASENNGEPYLNFFPANDNYKLYANEIQYLDFKTPLVILGACESNAGKKMKGSGVLSIAKAFSIGGCPSVVGSLWEVHDESMAVLVSLFYKHLMRGERKDVALRLAKLEYLETETGLRNDPPYYWAHLQIIGDVSPLIIWPVILRYVMYGLMVVILSGSIVYGIRSRKRFFN
jgi:CHAT domain-containing protein